MPIFRQPWKNCLFNVLIVFIALSIQGCLAQGTTQTPNVTDISLQSATTGSATPLTVTLPTVIKEDGALTFSDPALGFALEVPSDWNIQPRTEPIIGAWSPYSNFTSPCASTAPYVLPPCTGISIVPGPSSVYSLEELRDSSIPAGSVVFAEREIDLHGLRALWIETELGETDTSPKRPIIRVLILIGDRGVRLTAYGDLTPVADIFNTIRPLTKGSSSSP